MSIRFYYNFPFQGFAHFMLSDTSFTKCLLVTFQFSVKKLLEELHSILGDCQTKIGSFTFDASIHFYNLSKGVNFGRYRS
ncbi:uncharacterized protein LOC143229443 isoform X2 [Tachypleus tridentatus]|uniref:uncharacterized protein LOC143229443 isoform X2 n=1 Tax=Tachypleus tridentatus TaxID=6853 RepID=UPI003FD49A0B